MSRLLQRLRSSKAVEILLKRPRRFLSLLLFVLIGLQVIRTAYGAYRLYRINRTVAGFLDKEKEEKSDKTDQTDSWKMPELGEIDDPWKPKPNYSFTGVIGDAAVINDQFVEVGGKVNGATLESLEGNKAVIRKEDGQTQELFVFQDLRLKPPDPTPTAKPLKKEWTGPVKLLQQLQDDSKD